MTDLINTAFETIKEKKLKLATAESCTGGLIAAAITNIPGSSAVLERGFVTYSNESKMEMLGVEDTTINTHGAVSKETALEMAKGAIKHSRADLAVSVTGIAGPDGGSAEKPVGTVWFGYAATDGIEHTEKHVFEGTRANIREKTMHKALEIILSKVS